MNNTSPRKAKAMIIEIDDDLCSRCGHCSDFLEGLPEAAIGDQLKVPEWVCHDQELVDCITEMAEACEYEAISVHV